MSERQRSSIDPTVRGILDEEQAKDKAVREAMIASKEIEARILRARTAWRHVASFWGDAIPQGLTGEPLWRCYAERIVKLGHVLRSDGWYESAEIAPGPPAKKIAVEILRQAINGEIDNVMALLTAFDDTRYTVGPDSDNWLRVGLMYDFLPVEPPALEPTEETVLDDSPPAQNIPFLERLRQAAEDYPRVREAWQQERARRVEMAMYVGDRWEVELACDLARRMKPAFAPGGPGPGEPDAEVQHGSTTDRQQSKLEWLAKAMLLVQEYPERSDAKIAAEVHIHKSRLSRSKPYQAAAKVARTPKKTPPKGHVDIDPDTGKRRGIEAYDDEDAAEADG